MNFFLIIYFCCLAIVFAQENLATIPDKRVLDDSELLMYLDPQYAELATVFRYQKKQQTDKALQALMAYFREKSSRRYFFSWKNFPKKFAAYLEQYPEKFSTHSRLADYQMQHYAPETSWQLPFKNLLGNEVTAYELRHLSRQQKSFDMALMYYHDDQDKKYLDYFVRQVADLNRAFHAGTYDDEGNGVYERFRAGKRVINWLFCHHAYLASEHYDWEKQAVLIKTFLHHGAQLAQRTRKFNHGNHHTKGLVALFQIATLFPEFRDSQRWQQQAVNGLVEHLSREVNPDGFQFERSVHYHQGDIENYFTVYQLAKLNNVSLPEKFTSQFRKMFTALVNIAQPNRRAPVLQDDTDRPYAENNRIDNAMTLGALLFEDPAFKYFAGEAIPAKVFWWLRPNQIEEFEKLTSEMPTLPSVSLPQTGYYVMRSGWSKNDLYMIISAGLSAQKPDHQHGEMLSLSAYAYGQEILPHYQVNYNIPGYRYWKNSWVKNVALADSIPLGRGWRQNRGKSGFGKWKRLPKPAVIAWQPGETVDFFAASHNSYDSLGVAYSREVLFVKDGFWIVRDVFSGKDPHKYQQIWQGHYTQQKNENWLRATFPDGVGLDIIQLNEGELTLQRGGRDGKGNMIFTALPQETYEYLTIVAPFSSYLKAVKQSANGREWQAGEWAIRRNSSGDMEKVEDFLSDARYSFRKQQRPLFMFNLQSLVSEGDTLHFTAPANVAAEKVAARQWSLQIWGTNPVSFYASGPVAVQQNDLFFSLDAGEDLLLKPSDRLSVDFTAYPQVFMWDATALHIARMKLQSGDEQLAKALKKLRTEADQALRAGPFSVTFNEGIPPSGDKHDYVSMGPYWWPNPDTPDSLPYVRRDGEVNPEREQFDKVPGANMCDAVSTLALAYYFSGAEVYAARVAKLIRTWFLDEATAMNPHLNFGQFIPGRSQGRGVGIIESRRFCEVIDAVGLIAGSDAWQAKDREALQAWFREFTKWLIESDIGKDEARRTNNHGTWYDVQLSCFALFTGQDSIVARVMKVFPEKRLIKQIEPDGSQPLELARTRAYSYSVMNLHGMFRAAALAKRVNIDLFNLESADGRSIRKAMAFLLPFAVGEKEWPYQQITDWGKVQADHIFLLSEAGRVYQSEKYYQAARKLLKEIPVDPRFYLVNHFPLKILEGLENK